MSGFDSRPDTHEHIEQVRGLLLGAAGDLIRRGHVHDRSKLEEPELSAFNEATPKLRELTYGSPEYEQARADLGVALKHHYEVNSHHPEHHEDGVHGMSLLELLEMLCDWIAATRRHDDGDIFRSIEVNQERFGYGDELKQLLLNSVQELVDLEAVST